MEKFISTSMSVRRIMRVMNEYNRVEEACWSHNEAAIEDLCYGCSGIPEGLQGCAHEDYAPSWAVCRDGKKEAKKWVLLKYVQLQS